MLYKNKNIKNVTKLCSLERHFSLPFQQVIENEGQDTNSCSRWVANWDNFTTSNLNTKYITMADLTSSHSQTHKHITTYFALPPSPSITAYELTPNYPLDVLPSNLNCSLDHSSLNVPPSVCLHCNYLVLKPHFSQSMASTTRQWRLHAVTHACAFQSVVIDSTTDIWATLQQVSCFGDLLAMMSDGEPVCRTFMCFGCVCVCVCISE